KDGEIDGNQGEDEGFPSPPAAYEPGFGNTTRWRSVEPRAALKKVAITVPNRQPEESGEEDTPSGPGGRVAEPRGEQLRVINRPEDRWRVHAASPLSTSARVGVFAAAG